MDTSAMQRRRERLSPYMLSVVRIVAAFLFLQYGTAKWFGLPGPVMPDGGTVELSSQVGLAALLETIGGTLLLLGLFSRVTAFVLSGEMAVAYFIAHASQSFWPVLNNGTEAVLFSFLWLYISIAGPGPWSLDALIRRVPRPRAMIDIVKWRPAS